MKLAVDFLLQRGPWDRDCDEAAVIVVKRCGIHPCSSQKRMSDNMQCRCGSAHRAMLQHSYHYVNDSYQSLSNEEGSSTFGMG